MKYTTELRDFEYFGGYKEPGWAILNALGELCSRNHKTLVFNSQQNAQDYCDKLNTHQEGAMLTNLE